MAQKNLIIGGFTNYNYNQLKPWVESINEVCGENTDKVLIVGKTTKETVDTLKEKGFILHFMGETNLPIHVARFVFIYDYLLKNSHKYKYVVTTDVKDVYFQLDPFKWLKENLKGRKLVAGSEGMLYKDEPWGNQNLLQTYGDYIHNLFKDNEIYNVGTLGGEAEYIKDLVFNIFSNAVGRPIPIVDQAVYNVLINTKPYYDVTLFAQQKDGWACQAGTTVDPSKIKEFRPLLTEEEPIFEDGLVKTGGDSHTTKKGTPFVIVHQYDRVPEWKEFVREKFGQEDESQYFVYKTA